VLQAATKGSPVVRRAAQPVMNTGRGAQRRLVIRDAANNVELAENTYLAGASSADRPLRHLGREFGVVLSGRLRVEVGGERYVLRRGDAILLESSTPHRFTNVGREVVRTLWINVHGNRWSKE
jgi:quercetin dioxygenase-like cupin family protein